MAALHLAASSASLCRSCSRETDERCQMAEATLLSKFRARGRGLSPFRGQSPVSSPAHLEQPCLPTQGGWGLASHSYTRAAEM